MLGGSPKRRTLIRRIFGTGCDAFSLRTAAQTETRNSAQTEHRALSGECACTPCLPPLAMSYGSKASWNLRVLANFCDCNSSISLHTSGTASSSNLSAIRALQMELKSLQTAPVEGFTVQCDDQNVFKWTVAIFGPPGTLYQGGYFKATIKFPNNYPYSPPTLRFLSKVWHPNVYENGELCISILHPPVDDPHSGELACERWNPTQNVRTVLLSVISLLNEPNTSSPANVDASVMYRKWKEGKDDEYMKIVKKQVDASKAEAAKDGVKVPETIEEYCVKAPPKENDDADMLDLDDELYNDDYDNESSGEDFDDQDGEDSGF
ncbi:Ubiquitin conjugating-3 enzyme [Aphelenchoides bicaudatus]|nr:Ubiquitin conjugating-3 enzyme [Aphelenchoides bicaudatus]